MAVTKEGMAYRIAAGYKTSGEAVEFGSVVIDGQPYPACRVRADLGSLTQHGIVLGATGGGKTKTLQLIAEQLSDAGVPVVMTDVKGDLQGLAQEGFYTDEIVDRAISSGCDSWDSTSFPVEFATLGSEGHGIPIRASVRSFGPLLLAKVLEINDTQESVLRLIFGEAVQQELPLDTLEDLREAVSAVSRQNDDDDLGFISKATASVIMRAIRNLENDGGRTFFGTPGFDPRDLMRVTDDPQPRGYITLFELEDRRPVLFAIFMMWMLEKLTEILPEAGVVDKPKLVMILDEAHLLFNGASKAFVEQMISTVRLVRSKGVGLILCSQTAKSIPGEVMEQMGFRVQHALRVRTPEAHRALAHTVLTFPETDVYDLRKEIPALRKGEAVVTALTPDGGETPVAETKIRPPRSHMGPIGNNAVRRIVKASELYDKYHVEPEPEPEPSHETPGEPIRLSNHLPPYKSLSFDELLAMSDPNHQPIKE
ncbi:helicase HerA-like domain-containing protein [Nocardia jiangxiensis]|uniref:helicase HerA-like domain-containing protein n=1 Tax=Nocardia jiangxiensis TaxID=282685 RepID=UPI0002E9F52F|nr:helicase HerA-like domain-containing protein [Nocardia jiangxiensis]